MTSSRSQHFAHHETYIPLLYMHTLMILTYGWAHTLRSHCHVRPHPSSMQRDTFRRQKSSPKHSYKCVRKKPYLHIHRVCKGTLLGGKKVPLYTATSVYEENLTFTSIEYAKGHF